MMAPVLDELRADYEGQLEVLFIDVWKNPDEAKKYDVKIIPTQLFFDRSGKEFFRHEGFFAKEDILAKFSEFDIEFQAREADEDPSQEGQ
jgi:thioredoxin 1